MLCSLLRKSFHIKLIGHSKSMVVLTYAAINIIPILAKNLITNILGHNLLDNIYAKFGNTV